MNLIERYAQAVGRHLPKAQRRDIEAEIRSTIADMVDERSQQTGRPIDDEMTLEVLKEMGDPEKIATSYLPAQYLIGPRLFPYFVFVLKIVFAALAGALVLALVVRMLTGDLAGESLFQAGVDTMAGILSGLVAAFGNVVLVFAILERVIPAAEFDTKPVWDPMELAKAPDPDQVSRWELIIGTIFTVGALLVFNFYPQVIGLTFVHNGEWVFLPMLSEAFFRVMPLLNLEWGLQLVLNLALLRLDRWDVRLRWLAAGVQAIGVAVAILLRAGPSIVGLQAQDLIYLGVSADAAREIIGIVQQVVVFGLTIAIVVGAIEVVRTLLRIFRRPEPSPQPA